MNANHPSNWHEYPQGQGIFKQPLSFNSSRENYQPEEPRFLSLVREDFTTLYPEEEIQSESQEVYRSVLEHISDIVFITNEAGRFTFISPNVGGTFGYSLPEVREIGNITKLLGEDLFDWQDLQTRREIRNIEQQISDKSGRRRTLLVTVKRVSIEEGTVLYSCRDITDRKLAENELKQHHHHLEDRVAERTAQLVRANQQLSQEVTQRNRAETALLMTQVRMQHLLDSSPAVIYSCKPFGDYSTTFVSENVTTRLGYKAEEFLADSRFWIDRIHPADAPQVFAQLQHLPEHRQLTHEYRFLHKDGTYRWLHDELRLVEDVADQTLEIVGSWLDITYRKQTEETFRQQFQREQLVAATLGRIHQSLNLEETLKTTVAEVRQFLECDRVLIFHLHPDGSGVVVVESVSSGWKPMAGTVINDCYFAQAYIRLYQQGRVQAVEDIYKAGLAQCHVNLLAQFQARANLVVPIVHEEKLWGLLVAQQCSQTRKWQPLEIDLLKSLATQAAIAIHQSELYQQAQTEIAQRQQAEIALRQQFQRERLIGAITQRIRTSLNVGEILNATVAEVRQVLATDRVIIFKFEPDWSGNVVVESVDARYPAILGENIYDPCFEKQYVFPYQQGRVKAIEDIYTAGLQQCHFDLLTRFKVRANLVVPILHGEQLWGLLIAHHCSDARHWQQFEIDLLCSLASQVAIAIQQSQLYEQAQARAKREQAINQLTQAIRSSLDLETIFSTAVREIGELLQVDHVHIVQYSPEQKRWLHISEYSRHPGAPLSLGKEIPDENNPLAERLKQLEIVKIHDVAIFEDEISKSIAQAFPGAWLLVPLHFNDSVWGSITLMKNGEPYHWQESEVELIYAIADQVAIAIQQAELYKQSRRATAKALTQAQQLEQALQELQRTQGQLVQSEKMSSLGQLVAGVAHEINNPVSFIYGNLVHADGYIEDLLGLIELYQQHYPNPKPEVQSEISSIDLDFLIEDLPKLLDSMRVGAERICEIVSSLRNFSRLAEAEMKAVDIHEGLDSTLVILQNRLRAQGERPEIQIIREYGNLPKVECYAGQLNQVFMNLLTNAIDAIDEQNQMHKAQLSQGESPEQIKANPNIIRLHTEVLNNHQVVIRIADNGPGMTPQVKARLFDPFFTTKPVGVGTGLGLSISYQIIVEKHGGKIDCYSEPGQGTEFIIQIPLRQLTEEPKAVLA